MDNQSITHTRWNCTYHIVFIPKFRRKIMYGETKRDLVETIKKLCEMKQVTLTDGKIGDADYAYEIKSGSSQEEICGIISSICIDLKREDDFVNVRYENGEYIIISNGITIGRAVINDKATIDLLKIYFYNQ